MYDCVIIRLYDYMQDSPHPRLMSQRRYQQVLDAYGVGVLRFSTVLQAVALQDAGHRCQITRVLVETPQGLFLLVHAPDNELHPIWWDKETGVFLPLLTTAVGLAYAEPRATRGSEVFVVHRFDERFSLFQL